MYFIYTTETVPTFIRVVGPAGCERLRRGTMNASSRTICFRAFSGALKLLVTTIAHVHPPLVRCFLQGQSGPRLSPQVPLCHGKEETTNAHLATCRHRVLRRTPSCSWAFHRAGGGLRLELTTAAKNAMDLSSFERGSSTFCHLDISFTFRPQGSGRLTDSGRSEIFNFISVGSMTTRYCVQNDFL